MVSFPAEPSQILDYIVYVVGLRPSDLMFPDFVFYVLIPFFFSVWAMYLFVSGLRIFRFANFVNWVFAAIIVFIALRFIYPIIFVLSLGFLILTKRWLNSLWKRILFAIFMFVLYWFVVPYLIQLSRTSLV